MPLDPKEIALYLARFGKWSQSSKWCSLHLEGITTGDDELKIELQKLYPSLRFARTDPDHHPDHILVTVNTDEFSKYQKTQAQDAEETRMYRLQFKREAREAARREREQSR